MQGDGGGYKAIIPGAIQKTVNRGRVSRFSSLSYGAAVTAFVVVLVLVLVPRPL